MYITFGSVVERAGGTVVPALFSDAATPLQRIHSETNSATSVPVVRFPNERLIRVGSF